MKKFCTPLIEHPTNVLNFEKKKLLPLPKKELKLTACYICEKRLSKRFAKYKNYRKVRDHCSFTGKYRGAAHRIYNLRFNVLKEIPAVFNKLSNYDYHFIIKELVNEFEGQYECRGENTEKYKPFSVPIEK